MNIRGSGSSSSNSIDTKIEEHQICRLMQCSNCGSKLDRKPNWVGLPAGVKFDPTDQELIEHLEKKVISEDSKSKSHPLIDEFIPTIEGEDGICYTHPEKLPGVTMDGLSKHFFHRPSKAYTTGTRKRRKIIGGGGGGECEAARKGGGGETRWHKTGKTRAVMLNGRQKGCKKILVLYTNFGKHRKPEKTSWVMHQYHLGELEEEKEGELVVSKVFFQTQPRQCGWSTSVDRVSMASVVARDSGGGSCSSKESAGIGRPKEETVAAVGALHVSRPTIPVSTTILLSSSDHNIHHQVSSNIIHGDPYIDASRLMIFQQADKYQQQEQHEQQLQHQRIAERSGSGLEELILGCSSSGSKAETTISHPHDIEWQYSYWMHDNPDHDHV